MIFVLATYVNSHMMAEVNGVTVEHSELGTEEAGKSECVQNEVSAARPEELSSKDYYFDSYAHFGIHEVSYFISCLFTVNWVTKLYSDQVN